MIKFFENNNDTLYCFVDNTNEYKSSWIKDIIKNISDYTISNLWSKKLSLVQSENEDEMLNYAANNGYKNALVFSTGTEFINGNSFFSNVAELTKSDYFIYGHILDRKDAFYELHHQCYLINIEKYIKLNRPKIGITSLGSTAKFNKPITSISTIHDDYTPRWIKKGNSRKLYNHKLHGWNIIAAGLEANYTINAWPEEARANKMHYYPESSELANTNLLKIYKKINYCQSSFVHKSGTDSIDDAYSFKTIVTPASNNWWEKFVTDNTEIVLYDYNQESLDYWQTITKHRNIRYINCNLLTENLLDYIEDNDQTLINLSNIFCYEGSAALYSLEYRLFRENFYRKSVKYAKLVITGNAAAGFADSFPCNIRDLKKPTWHISEWNYE